MKAKHILMIEDNDNDIALAQRAFKKAGLVNELVVVRDGMQALETLLPNEGPTPGGRTDLPGMVLLDLDLPGVNGQEILRRIRSHPDTYRLPVVIFTASDTPEDVITAYTRGVDWYASKPVRVERLREVAEQMGLADLFVVGNADKP